MYKILIILIVIVTGFLIMSSYYPDIFIKHLFKKGRVHDIAVLPIFPIPSEQTWDIQSIDTMKYSRDLARKKANDPAFLELIDEQMKNIADTGANYVAIGTPYDQEFFPMLKHWVVSARKYGLHVWFRGNWSGWEGWFDYPMNMSRIQHINMTKKFIFDHPDIFEDGDIFSACPECENGGSGDPRKTGDIAGFRSFIISEYKTEKEAFDKIGKKVSANYYPMNKDVSQLIMDKETTEAMDGIIVIDHYVKSSDVLVRDLQKMKELTGGAIVLGEFGAPLPEISGKMTEKQQAQWINDVLAKTSNISGIKGVNYWLNMGGSTAIWDKDGKALPAVLVLKKYFKTETVFGIVTNESNQPIDGAKISFSGGEVFSREDGYFEIRYVERVPIEIKVSSVGFLDQNIMISNKNDQAHIILRNDNKDDLFKW